MALTDIIPSSDFLMEITELSINNIYHSKQVLEREASGYEVIEKLMETFCLATYYSVREKDRKSAKHSTMFRLIPDHLVREMQETRHSTYDLLQVVIDYVSSLTDSTAIRLFQTVSGNTKI
jgi:dGTPase